MTARDAILGRVPEGTGSQAPEPFRLDLELGDLVATFVARLAELGGRVVAPSDVASLEGRTWCVDPSVAPLASEYGEFVATPAWEAEVGVTQAAVGVAETGTLLLVHDPTDHRLASLAPPLHVAILDRSAIVATLDEAFDRLPARNAVLVTGPSRTADIEGVLVRGVHGPRELWVVLRGH